MGHPRGTHGNVTHGLTYHPLYRIWKNMMYRCYTEGNPYQVKGIKVYEPWHDLVNFIKDIERDIGPRPGRMSINRINNQGNYWPGNIEWATAKRQASNRG